MLTILAYFWPRSPNFWFLKVGIPGCSDSVTSWNCSCVHDYKFNALTIALQ